MSDRLLGAYALIALLALAAAALVAWRRYNGRARVLSRARRRARAAYRSRGATDDDCGRPEKPI